MRPRRRSLTLAGASAIALTVGVAAPAHAAFNISYDPVSKQVYASGTPGVDDVEFSCVGGNLAPPTAPDTLCADIESFFVTLPGLGEDSVDMSAVSAANFPNVEFISIDGSDDFEADQLTGSQFADSLTGDSQDILTGLGGNDRLTGGKSLDGGAGEDIIEDFGGEGQGKGGAGNDRFIDSLPLGGLDGGTGHDTFEADFNKSSSGGSLPDLVFTFGAATLRVQAPGAAFDQTFLLANMEEALLTMPNVGVQTVNARQFPGPVHLRGFAGRDILTGTTGSSDVLAGGFGDDVINARDGRRDIVRCGPGNDVAKVDPVDAVEQCETLKYPAVNTSKIRGPKRIKKGATGIYKFRSGTPGAVFQCKLDKKRWKKCSSPHLVVANKKLSVGKHVLRVRAGAPAGNWDRTPSKKAFSVVR